MGICAKRKEAEAAAVFVRRSSLSNTAAIRNLGQFAAELGLFNHTEADPDTDWDQYTRRCDIERAEDQITVQSQQNGLAPKSVIDQVRRDTIDQKAEEAKDIIRLINPLRRVHVTDPEHVDWNDPEDFFRTRLMKAAIDNDIHRVTELVEQHNASLFAKDAENKNALATALAYGNLEVAQYLRSAMLTKPQQVHLAKSA
jgi:hypothetical protein